MKSKLDYPTVNVKAADGVKPDGTPYNIMVVEDQEFTRKMIVQILESEGYKIVAQAANGKAALDMLKKLDNKVDLITTDLDMPEMDGYALLYEIVEQKLPVKVVFISEDTTKGVIADLLKMGARDFILKPPQRGKILERIKLAFGKTK